MTDQTLRLNKIEIGQFLNMKNKVGIPKNNGIAIRPEIESDTLYLSSSKPVTIIDPMVQTITKKAIGRSFGTFNSRPSLFTKISSLTKVTLEQDRTISGMPINVIKNTISARYENPSPEFALGVSKKDIRVPKDIQNQNTKFQILSWFNHFNSSKLVCFTKRLPLSLTASATSIMRPKFRAISLLFSVLIKFFISASSKYLFSLLNISLIDKKFFLSAAVITTISTSNVSFAQSDKNISKMISATERNHDIPAGLLAAIASVESGLKPYAIGVSGKSVNASSKGEAKQIIKEYLAKGITNIDIGIMQINWRWHSKEFNQDLDHMLNPLQNIIYAAQLLKSLHVKHQSWQKAVRYYHSAKDEHHRKYSKAVLVSWIKQN